MKVAMFSTRKYEKDLFEQANNGLHEIRFLETRLTPETVEAALGCVVVCCFANDQINRLVIEQLKNIGVQLIALRSAGYNHVDLEAAKELGIPVVRVPEYSPYAVAEHATAMMLALNRKIHRAYNRVRELNFSLDGLVGFDVHGKTVGVIGAGRIGKAFCKIMAGFGCRVIVHDPVKDPQVGAFAEYVTLEELFKQSDIISLHVPLTATTRHILDQRAFSLMKPNAYLINTGRGALIETKALIEVLKSKKLGGACLDVYEEEENVFSRDLSQSGISDDLLARLLTFPNVIITAHQAFLTTEALKNIADATIANITLFEVGQSLQNRVA